MCQRLPCSQGRGLRVTVGSPDRVFWWRVGVPRLQWVPSLTETGYNLSAKETAGQSEDAQQREGCWERRLQRTECILQQSWTLGG